MKRISDFEDCRMDMKNMAALNGGGTTSSNRMATYKDCGDLAITTWKDNRDGFGNLYFYDPKLEIIMADCPDDYVITDPSFATSYLVSNVNTVFNSRY